MRTKLFWGTALLLTASAYVTGQTARIETEAGRDTELAAHIAETAPCPTGTNCFVETACNIDMPMIWVAGGTFRMGCTDAQEPCDDDERPVKYVHLEGFYIGKFEVTQSQWEKIMGSSIRLQCEKADGVLAGEGPMYPMYYVSLEEAEAFVRELSLRTGKRYRLPSEAQWEYAARGGAGSGEKKYCGSDLPDSVAWYSANSGGSAHPVGLKHPNAIGLHDMSGNVWEWCAGENGQSVMRGGSWRYPDSYCRIANRFSDTPDDRDDDGGFRVVLLP